MIPNVLSIAGSDPSGGAGIQADLKAIAASGGYGLSVITALTAQNTVGVQGVHPVPAEFVTAQLSSVFDDVRVDAVKIGMLGDASVIDAVAAALRRHRPPVVVLDPVMVAKSGDRLLDADAVAHLRSELLPLADLITPNLPEAADLLSEQQARSTAEMAEQIHRLNGLGPHVLLKGGHLPGGDCDDLLLIDGVVTTLDAPRVATTNTHGTGCALSAAIAALRPVRPGWIEAVRDAKTWLTGALRHADELTVGSGHGPPHHFYEQGTP